MIVRDPKSDLFIAICTGCGMREHIDSDTGFGAASLASGAGWSLGLRDLCRDCRPSEDAGRKVRRARSSA
jgi:hypothetical protein